MGVLGFVSSATAVGLGPVAFKPNPRGFLPASGKPIVAQAIVEEVGHDELEITDHPTEQNAAITDHAYKKPVEVVIHCMWSNSPSKPSSIVSQAVGALSTFSSGVGAISAVGSTVNAASSILSGKGSGQVTDIYKQLQTLQSSRALFQVQTGKRLYKNMLFKSLTQTTNKQFENALMITAVCREVIIVTTQVNNTQVNPSALLNPAANSPLQNLGQQALAAAPAGFSLPAGVSLPNVSEALNAAVGAIPSGLGTSISSALTGALPSLSNVLPFEIPTIPSPQQFLTKLAGSATQITANWNGNASAWMTDVADAAGNKIAAGIPLVTGSDLLGPLAHLNIGGSMLSQTDNNPTLPPSFASLGSTGHLYFVAPNPPAAPGT